MKSGMVDSTVAWSPVPWPNALSTMPPNSLENDRGDVNAPSAAPPIITVNSGAPETTAIKRSTMRRGVISVAHPLALGAELAAHEVVDLDRDLDQRVEDDEAGAQRDHRYGEVADRDGQREQAEVDRQRVDVGLGDDLAAQEPARVEEQGRREDRDARQEDAE